MIATLLVRYCVLRNSYPKYDNLSITFLLYDIVCIRSGVIVVFSKMLILWYIASFLKSSRTKWRDYLLMKYMPAY